MTCQQIKEFCDEQFGFDIAEKNRKETYLEARWTYYYLCYKYSLDGFKDANVSAPVKLDRGTARHGLIKFFDYYETTKIFKIKVSKIESEIRELIPCQNTKEIDSTGNLSELKMKRMIINQRKRIEKLATRLGQLRIELMDQKLINEKLKEKWKI